MNLQNQLKKINAKKIKAKNGKAYGDILYSEAKRLMKCIEYEFNLYMASYTPKVYKRTGSVLSSVCLQDYVQISANGRQISVKIYFDQHAYHPSGFGIKSWNGNGSSVNAVQLLNYGYEVKKDVWFKDIENFGYRSGGNFIEKGVDDFLSNNPYGIKVKINKSNPYE